VKFDWGFCATDVRDYRHALCGLCVQSPTVFPCLLRPKAKDGDGAVQFAVDELVDIGVGDLINMIGLPAPHDLAAEQQRHLIGNSPHAVDIMGDGDGVQLTHGFHNQIVDAVSWRGIRKVVAAIGFEPMTNGL
jgi:hypothetical protein